MSSHIDALKMRRCMGPGDWLAPTPFGPDGWQMVARDHQASIIATCSPLDGDEWVHASIARHDRMPSYEDLKRLHAGVFIHGQGFAYQVFLRGEQHVNIHEHALHLWGRLDGKPMLPQFGMDTSLGWSI
jgi:hypothetical protein